MKKIGRVFRKQNKNQHPAVGRGGKAGEIYIFSQKVIGGGEMLADGGDGVMGGEGGRVTMISDDNRFSGKLSAKGGNSLVTPNRWWENTWTQIIFLLGAVAGIIGLVLLFM